MLKDHSHFGADFFDVLDIEGKFDVIDNNPAR